MTETRTTWGFVAYFLDLGSLASGGLTALMVTGLALLAAGIVRAAAWHTLARRLLQLRVHRDFRWTAALRRSR